MKKRELGVLLAVISAFFVACKPEFSVNDEKQDISIAYCLLDKDETNHYIKIYKAFLTEENAYTFASNSGIEAICYMDSIEVVMEEYENGKLNRTTKCDTTTAIPKDAGIFPYPTQILYVAKNTKLNPAATYRLKLKNKYTGKESHAETNIVNGFYISLPAGELDLTYDKLVNCGFTLPVNGSSYEIYQTLRYIEEDKTTGEKTNHSVRRKVSNGEVNPTGATIIKYTISNIYKTVGDQVKKNDKVKRYIDTYKCVDYEVWIAGKVLSSYIRANNQPSTVVNNKVDYTNFISEDNSAFGIFSSRDSSKRAYVISAKSEDSLVYGQYTKHLGFVKSTD